MAARKFLAVLSYRVAMERNCLSLAKKFSINGVGFKRIQQRVCAVKVARLAGGQMQADRIASASTVTWIWVLRSPRLSPMA